jgi:hypothetical protein
LISRNFIILQDDDDDEHDRDDLEFAKMLREFMKMRNANTASKAVTYDTNIILLLLMNGMSFIITV